MLTVLPFKARDGSGRKHEVFVGPGGGYAEAMSDGESPTPPGSPMRDDAPAGGRPGGHDDETSASKANDESAEEAGGHTIPIEDEQPDPATEPGEGHELQEENAETSEDQPSQ